MRANRGVARIDRQTIADVEQYGVSLLLDKLAADLKDGRWSRLPARRVFIPKPGREELRPLSIPAVRDRVVQAAVKTVIEPIFEADMLERSFGFSSARRSTHDALHVLVDQAWGGQRWVCWNRTGSEARRSATTRSTSSGVHGSNWPRSRPMRS